MLLATYKCLLLCVLCYISLINGKSTTKSTSSNNEKQQQRKSGKIDNNNDLLTKYYPKMVEKNNKKALPLSIHNLDHAYPVRNLISSDEKYEYNISCTDNIYALGNLVDIGAMLYNCSNSIASALQPPSYLPLGVDGAYIPTTVKFQLVLNNLIEIDDISSQFVTDFFLRLIWTDPRISMPDLWPLINPEAQYEGIEISKYISNQEELNIWKPDIFFFQSVDMQSIDELFKILQNGTMYWSRHILGRFSVLKMPLYDFPGDKQNFSITAQSFAYDSAFLRIEYIDGKAIVLSDDIQTGDIALKSNDIWNFIETSAFIEEVSLPSPTNPTRSYDTAYQNVVFRRESSGIVYRLAFPVLIFLVLVGASFWASEDKRVDVALQVLLAVAALYIFIGQVIPFVGYLTTLDWYMITVYSMLAFAVFIHFVQATLNRKIAKYPLDRFFSECLILFFRTIWIPSSLLIFGGYFQSTADVMVPVISIACILFFIYCLLKLAKLANTFKLSILELRIKEDLVQLGAVDNESGLKIHLQPLERWALTTTRMFFSNPNYDKLLFSNDLESIAELPPEQIKAITDRPRLNRERTLKSIVKNLDDQETLQKQTHHKEHQHHEHQEGTLSRNNSFRGFQFTKMRSINFYHNPNENTNSDAAATGDIEMHTRDSPSKKHIRRPESNNKMSEIDTALPNHDLSAISKETSNNEDGDVLGDLPFVREIDEDEAREKARIIEYKLTTLSNMGLSLPNIMPDYSHATGHATGHASHIASNAHRSPNAHAHAHTTSHESLYHTHHTSNNKIVDESPSMSSKGLVRRTPDKYHQTNI